MTRLLAALAIILGAAQVAGCTCSGAQPASDSASGANNAPAHEGAPTDEPAKVAKVAKSNPAAREHGKLPRTGFIAATVDGKAVRFEQFPVEKNRHFNAGPSTFVAIHGVQGGAGKASLKLELRGVDLKRSVGTGIMPAKGAKQALAMVQYDTGDGKVYLGTQHRAPRMDIVITKLVDGGRQIEGRFSGTLKLVSGDETITLDAGTFFSELTPQKADTAAAAQPGAAQPAAVDPDAAADSGS